MIGETWERPLPLSLQPAAGESLAGYLLCLADRLMSTPGETAARVGLTDRPGDAVPNSYAVGLPAGVRGRFLQATGLTDCQVDAMLLSGWDGRLFTPRPPSGQTVNTAGRYWAWELRTRACPTCLSESTPTGEASVWRLSWRTGWAFACTDHGRLLADRCPGCASQIGTGPGQGLLRGTPTIPVDGCRSCGQTLRADQDATEPDPVAAAVLDAQRTLDTLFTPAVDATVTCPHALGVDVDPAQYLRDLRLLAVVLDASRTVPSTDVPTALAAALAERADAHESLARTAAPGRAQPRAWSTPPATALHAAAIVTTVMRVLELNPAEADIQFASVVEAARRREPLLVNRIRWTFNGSAAVLALLRDPVRNTFTASALRGARRQPAGPKDLDPRTVPAFLPRTDYTARFGWLHPEPTVRRAIPILAVRLLTGGSAPEAADLLGVQNGSAVAAQTRLARAARGPGEAYALREAVAALVGDWAVEDGRPDLRHRREALADWQIDTDAWQELVDPLRALEAARGGKRVNWAGLRVPGSILLWELLTGGEAAQSPLAGTGTTSQVTALHKGVSGLRTALAAYAARLVPTLDQAASNQPDCA